MSIDTVAAFVERRLGAAEEAEVLGHMERCDDCRTLIALSTRSVLRDTDLPRETARREPAADDANALVARYRIERVLGAGSMGVVYAARDPRLGRTLAIKVLRSPAEGDPTGADGATRRLLREAQAMAKLSHPNVVAIYDVGVIDGRVFIAMEHVDGVTCAEWLSAGPRSWREVLRVFVEAGRGLAAAHRAGLVLRDFKPENMLVGNDGRVRVSDFGVARADERGTGGTPGSRASTLAGTPAYMAPEQARGQQVDARTDQFTFALALHEALYGVRPEGAHIALRGERTVWPASTGHAPRSVRRALARALEEDAHARFASIDELLSALERRSSVVPLAATAIVACALFVVIGSRGGRHLQAPILTAAASTPPFSVDAPRAPSSASATASDASPAPTAIGSATPAVRARPRPRPVPSASAAPPTGALDARCTPPFTYDDLGEKHFKPECFGPRKEAP